MRTISTMCTLLAALGLGSAARAGQELDSPRADPSHHRVELENEWVRVVRWSIPPHEKTALHDHPSLVSVFLTDGDVRLTAPDGKVTEAHVKAGAASWRGPTVHVAENIGDRPVEGILVEPKGAGNPSWSPPAHDGVRLAPHDRLEFENDRVRIVRYAYGKGEGAPMHDHPAGVQILLTDARARQTSPDGKSSEASAKAGTVRYRPPLTHAFQNLGERFEGILVDLKGAPPAGG